MRGSSFPLRWLALSAASAWGVHQGRYLLAFGDRHDEVLAQQGHAYLSSVTPVLVLALIAALGQALSLLAQRREDPRRGLGSRATWGVTFAALVVVFVAQELLEGLLSAGHAAGLHGVFGNGGWVAVPLAAVASAGVAWLLRAVRQALRGARRPALAWTGVVRGGHLACTPGATLVAPSPMAAQRAGRAPPRLA